jgi:hypothetical protein
VDGAAPRVDDERAGGADDQPDADVPRAVAGVPHPVGDLDEGAGNRRTGHVCTLLPGVPIMALALSI